MDRLTIRFDADNIGLFGDDGTYYRHDLPHVWNAIERLADYEDTGLSPYICAQYKLFEDEAVSKGTSFNRIVELMNLESLGRLVTLPCKVGETVYRVWKVDGRKTEITEHKMENIVQIAQWLHLFGKTVFVLRTEAEAYAEKETLQK